MKPTGAFRMKILALEFSSPRRSVAVLSDEPANKPATLLGSMSDHGGRAAKPIPLIEQTLDRAKIEREEIDLIVVGLGPGSYTGIRSAIAAAQGWQLARSTRLLGLSSAECLAAQAQAQEWFGEVVVVVDAPRGEFYIERFDINAQSRCSIEPLRIARPEEAGTLTLSERIMVGPEVTKFFPRGRILFPEASTLGKLARGRTDFVSGDKLEPIYLRVPAFAKTPPPRVWPGI